MKLLVVMGIEAYQKELKKILFENGVLVFSEMDASGFKIQKGDSNRSNNWFSGNKIPVYSTVNLAFTEEEQAAKVLNALEKFNSNSEVVNPFHGYQLQVEKSI